MQFVPASITQRIATRAHDCLLEPSSSGLRMCVDRPPPSAHKYPLRERCGSQRSHATRTRHELPQIMRIQLHTHGHARSSSTRFFLRVIFSVATAVITPAWA